MTQDCSITLLLSPTKTNVMTTNVFQRATTVTGTDIPSGPGIEELPVKSTDHTENTECLEIIG